ncbi:MULTISPECIES: Flp pilus assembly protein CpaB [unclassified Sphingomonas]|uniref:Flp pilus assembly protein CpaB n=1 Tax=unclassified Sphingomonas TaxID=196159 RepID=UPI000925FAD7|nr:MULTISPECIES: Flp pilus assembly protein CpaB [unclassified Sphingomonas]MBN8848536.1 Flp pilus assembly protein CpaB [Sphingomonas sp.]OJV30688.1 MAG: Flp pilus assembly protein CpaB [Sphingomonas sp. 67-36]
MQGRNLIVIGIAVLIGIVAVIVANAYFSGVETRSQQAAKDQQQQTVVVAAQDLEFGTTLTNSNLRLASYPAASVPTGAFTSIAAAVKNNRVALRPIVTGEPVLASKVSGTDGRATIAANLPPGKLAFAISINEVHGVGGFARPGDVVDVLLTRPIPGEGATPNDKMTDVVLENVPVLGIDQVSDENATKPVVSKSATLEVDTVGAQKLALAQELGVLTLALRNVADQVTGTRATVLPRQLSATNYVIPAKRPAASAPALPRMTLPPPRAGGPFNQIVIKGPAMTVIRGTTASEYGVQRGQ